MLLVRNWTETAYTSTPGTTAIMPKSSIRRSFSREPNTLARCSRHSACNCQPTSPSSASATSALSASNHA